MSGSAASGLSVRTIQRVEQGLSASLDTRRVFSRKIVGHEVHEAESAEPAALLMRRASLARRPLVLHSDNR